MSGRGREEGAAGRRRRDAATRAAVVSGDVFDVVVRARTRGDRVVGGIGGAGARGGADAGRETVGGWTGARAVGGGDGRAETASRG